MSTYLFLLALALMVLAPNNPVGLLLMLMIACLRVWRTGDAMDLESGDSDRGNFCGKIDSENFQRDCDLT